MSEALDATASLAYEAYRQAHMGTVAGGLPMPVFEQLSVPERDAWLAVAGAVTPADPPALMRRQDDQEEAPRPPAPPLSSDRWAQQGLEQLTVAELRELAQAKNLSVPSGVSKQHLIDTLLADQATREGGHR